MALPDSELKTTLRAVGAFVEKLRPPPNIRPKLDYRVTITGSEVLILEVRPDWEDQTTMRETPVARLRWFNSRKIWRLYWMRADMKWHAYEPRSEASKIATLLKIVAQDEYGCFFG